MKNEAGNVKCTEQVFLVIFKKGPSSPVPFRDFIMSLSECSVFIKIMTGFLFHKNFVGLQLRFLLLNKLLYLNKKIV